MNWLVIWSLAAGVGLITLPLFGVDAGAALSVSCALVGGCLLFTAGFVLGDDAR